MKTVFLSLLLSCVSFAATDAIDITAKVVLNNGETSYTSHIVVKEGQKASLTNTNASKTQKTFMDVVATREQPNEEGTRAILLVFTVGTIEADGSRKILSNPRIVTLENEPAKITQGTKPGDEGLSVTAVAKSVQL